MSVRYSFVVPVRNEAVALVELMPALRRRFPGAELLVVDGGSTDRSVATAMPYSDRLLLSEPGRALQMNLGARAASGDYLLFLHSDSMPEFSEAQLLDWMEREPHWGFCRVQLSGPGLALRVIERAMNLRSRTTRVATGDQLLMVHRQWFLARGAFANLPLMEDVEVCKRLRRESPPALFDGIVCTSSRRWEEQGVVATVIKMWLIRLAYVCGVSPHRLWRHYYGT